MSEARDQQDSRRSFLKLAGFTVVAGCTRGIEHKAVPLLLPIEEITPGRSTWYATACDACPAGCGVLAKSRVGRPIKLEGNPQHPLSRGGLCATGQASVLGLYDSHRLTGPLDKGKPSTWKDVDAAIRKQLAETRGGVRVLTSTLHGPTVRAAIDRFCKTFPDARHVMYDAVSSSALLDAHEDSLGRRALPRLRFEKAQVIVGFDADFLGTWISPAEFTRDYRAGRSLDQGSSVHSHHTQFEGHFTLTGSNADVREAVDPEGMGRAVAGLAAAVARLLDKPLPVGAKPDESIDALAKRLVAAPRGRTLIVCGINDLAAQRLVAATNALLGNYGSTLETATPSFQRLGNDADIAALRDEIAAGEVGALLVAGANPVYDLPFELELQKIGLVVSVAERVDETAESAHFVCPDHHPLEAWTDGEPIAGQVTVGQPLVRPLHRTRAWIESLAAWTGGNEDSLAIMRKTYSQTLFARRKTRGDSFELFWSRAVHDGFVELEPAPARAPKPIRTTNLAPPQQKPREAGQLALLLYPSVGMLDGRHGHNPWLHELPDPVTKVVWDNYAALSPATAKRLGVETGDLVEVAGLSVAVQVQPGQHDDVVAIAVGYGRKGTDRFMGIGPEWVEAEPTVESGALVGVNAFKLAARGAVEVKPTGKRRPLACTQGHHALTPPNGLGEKRSGIARTASLAAFRKDPAAGNPHGHQAHSLWPDDHGERKHHWGMVIDLSACTGCSACMIACQTENNVPIVGRDEARRHREMHWMRIDRYQDGTEVVHQPMLCQHCDNAPCETVCPVLATIQSSEGLNQQVYNRCVGTRYCANNCPYKTRRFNWFEYAHDDKLQNLGLNPDVVVRTRGVMEKCSLCIQRIAEAKAEARQDKRPVRDGEIAPACMQSCPAQAIVFGDMLDEKSAVSRARRDPRHYHVLGELDTRPGVGYLTQVRNRDA